MATTPQLKEAASLAFMKGARVLCQVLGASKEQRNQQLDKRLPFAPSSRNPKC